MTASAAQPVAVRRSDYQPPAFLVERTSLEFDLDPRATLVTAELELRANPASSGGSGPRTLWLDGQRLHLLDIQLDGQPLTGDRFQQHEHGLEVRDLPAQCRLRTRVQLDPAGNTSLYGLYQSSDIFCTQCEAHGFRKITFYPDRPDVMAPFHVTLRAEPHRYPVLLSNGNRLSQRELADGRLEVVWEDPFPKPSYLFALVGGDLRCHRGMHRTPGGRDVQLEIWVEPQNIDKCEHALRSLQKSMRWDEERFGLEYDLDVYMIVAVNDFNMGAMENKGLNIFNSKFVLASPATATDDDYERIEAVIAHEYFHNWTGNRVTCRDWFQLTLKEGLTVFRDQEFTADQTSAAEKRIRDVLSLRARQFPEDAGPMAHPIRPESYISMDNFYTTTVYEKGAEIIRIYQQLLGRDGFRRGMDLYFQRHDGQAVTCDDFRAAMADANQLDLSLLDRWYSQAGTPTLEAKGEFDAEAGEYRLTLRQSYPPLPDAAADRGRLPVPIPVVVGLLDSQGRDLPLSLRGPAAADGVDALGATREVTGETGVGGDTNASSATSQLVLLSEVEQQFTFEGLQEAPVPSVLRGFSAPVRLRMERTPEELATLWAHDRDAFNRWDAGQTLATQILLEMVATGPAATRPAANLGTPPDSFVRAFGSVLTSGALSPGIKALMLQLPSELVVGQELEELEPELLHESRQQLRQALAQAHREALQATYVGLRQEGPYRHDRSSIQQRALKNVCLGYLASLAEAECNALVEQQYRTADNMTDAEFALMLLVDLEGPRAEAYREASLADFHERWRADPLVLDKWFAVQAASRLPATVARVRELQDHADFLWHNPNRVRALLGTFAASNQRHFHSPDGSGYELLAEAVRRVDPANPQLAARLAKSLHQWRRVTGPRREKMLAALTKLAELPGLSADLHEILTVGLQGAEIS